MGSIFSAALDRTAEGLDRWLGWDRPPLPMAILMLIGLRSRLRQESLYDTGKGRSAEPRGLAADSSRGVAKVATAVSAVSVLLALIASLEVRKR
jgi:hypothetical protein